MSQSYSIDHLVTSVEDVSVEVAAKSELSFSNSGIDNSGLPFATYSLASGDNAFPATVTFKSGIQPRKNAGSVRYIAVQFNTWATKTDSVSGVDTKSPLQAQVSFTLPTDMTIETADMDDLVGNLFSFLYPSVTTKVRSTAWLSKLLYGGVTVA